MKTTEAPAVSEKLPKQNVAGVTPNGEVRKCRRWERCMQPTNEFAIDQTQSVFESQPKKSKAEVTHAEAVDGSEATATVVFESKPQATRASITHSTQSEAGTDGPFVF